MKPLARAIRENAERAPDAPAFFEPDSVVRWAEYDARSDRLAAALVASGLEAGDRVGVLLPDGAAVHAAYAGLERAGCVVVGVGPRAGLDEIRHLLARTEARALLCEPRHRELDAAELVAQLRAEGLPLERHLPVSRGLGEDEPLLQRGDGAAAPAERSLAADDVFLLNSTSGTTGLPKCVIHDQARWLYFHELAVEAGELGGSDVFMSVVPSPFGFGIWTAHVTPTLLGAPVVLMPRFTPEDAIRAIERHRVTVLAAVSTQFIMMLGSPELGRRDVSSLRVLFTGGEAVPRERAAEFEERTGALVLQFYGSNETGALSRTTTRDSREARLSTAGRIIEGMHVRLFDESGRDVTSSGRGQPGCRGPATSRGYYDDPAANEKLYTKDGWMLTGDVASLDAEGYLRVIGRAADFIIRGGKNVSAMAVEEAVSTHPAVALAAAVPMPDPVFGERVCVYAELRPGRDLDLPELVAHLEARGVSKETYPERLIAVDELPRASGGKIAKQRLREDVAARLEAERGEAGA